jgi:ElaB/YqjD/DUF883 family membrane-anchored ribosome-binding protein
MDLNTHLPSADQVRDRLTHSLEQMVDEADQLLKSAQHAGSDQFHEARAKFETQLRHARSELADVQHSAAANARRAARAADHAVHEHPYTAMGVTAGIGVLIGMLITRR